MPLPDIVAMMTHWFVIGDGVSPTYQVRVHYRTRRNFHNIVKKWSNKHRDLWFVDGMSQKSPYYRNRHRHLRTKKFYSTLWSPVHCLTFVVINGGSRELACTNSTTPLHATITSDKAAELSLGCQPFCLLPGFWIDYDGPRTVSDFPYGTRVAIVAKRVIGFSFCTLNDRAIIICLSSSCGSGCDWH